jgi:penicillin-binding protein 2B
MIAKTGTGQIYNEETGTYDEERYTSSIMAAAPQDSPQVMVYWGMVSTNYLEYSAEPFQDIMHAALIAQGVSGSNDNDNDQNYEKWETYEMPSLVNHSMTYAEQQLDGKKVKVVKIGEGSNVIDQYPLRGTVVNSNDRVFLVTNDTSIKMPDMTGWTRKDLTAFWQLTGISIQTDGYGKVVSQNQNVGNTITKDTVIEVKLE